MAAYRWEKYNSVETKTYSVGSGTYASITSFTNTNIYYVDSSAFPPINSDGKFDFTNGTLGNVTSSTYSKKYWCSSSSGFLANTTESDYVFLPTYFKSSFIYATVRGTRYGITSTSAYSKGDLVDGNVTSTDRNAYPDDARSDEDGYWYVYVGEVSEKNLSVTYNGEEIISGTADSVEVAYNGSTLFSLSEGTKTLKCAEMVMRSDVAVGSKTLKCSGKQMATDIVVSLTS